MTGVSEIRVAGTARVSLTPTIAEQDRGHVLCPAADTPPEERTSYPFAGCHPGVSDCARSRVAVARCGSSDIASPDAWRPGVAGARVRERLLSRLDRRRGGSFVGSDGQLRRPALRHLCLVRAASGGSGLEDGERREGLGDRPVRAASLDAPVRGGEVRVVVCGVGVQAFARLVLSAGRCRG